MEGLCLQLVFIITLFVSSSGTCTSCLSCSIDLPIKQVPVQINDTIQLTSTENCTRALNYTWCIKYMPVDFYNIVRGENISAPIFNETTCTSTLTLNIKPDTMLTGVPIYFAEVCNQFLISEMISSGSVTDAKLIFLYIREVVTVIISPTVCLSMSQSTVHTTSRCPMPSCSINVESPAIVTTTVITTTTAIVPSCSNMGSPTIVTSTAQTVNPELQKARTNLNIVSGVLVVLLVCVSMVALVATAIACRKSNCQRKEVITMTSYTNGQLHTSEGIESPMDLELSHEKETDERAV